MKSKKIISVLLMCAFLAASFTIGVSAAVPWDNMIAMYNMENSLTNSVTGANGTLMNGASFAFDADRGGYVLVLANNDIESPGVGLGYDAEGQHAILADSYVPNGDQLTISLWFKQDEIRTWARVIDMGCATGQMGGDVGSQGRFINISPSNGSEMVGTHNSNDTHPNDASGRDRAFGTTPAEGQWVHAALVIDGSSLPALTLYVAGAAYVADDNMAGHSPSNILEAFDGVGSTFLGRSRFENNGDQIFNGSIDDVAIFNVALTAAQIAELGAHDFAAPPAAEPEPEPEQNLGEGGGDPADIPAPAAIAAPAPAAPAPQTADPISLIIIGSIISAAGVVIAKKRK